MEDRWNYCRGYTLSSIVLILFVPVVLATSNAVPASQQQQHRQLQRRPSIPGGVHSAPTSAPLGSPVRDPASCMATTCTSSKDTLAKVQTAASMSNDNEQGGTSYSQVRVVFSDVDGTLVHYSEEIAARALAREAVARRRSSGSSSHGEDITTTRSSTNNNDDDDDADKSLIFLPASSTGHYGVISAKTLRLAQQLRTHSSSAGMGRIPVKLVLVSGMRGTTMFKRLPYLPRADAYASDSGGRIFHRVDDVGEDSEYDGPIFTPVPYEGASEQDLLPFGIAEDVEWRQRISQLDAAGNDGYDYATPIEKRQGLLWDFARTLLSEGYVLDYKGYSTCFRVNQKQQPSYTEKGKFDLLRYIKSPEGIATSINLGCVDFYPSQSGKKNCCQYLLKKFAPSGSSLSTSAVCICDDDNDLEMALACRMAFIPGVTSESMAKTIGQYPAKFTVTEDRDRNIVETTATEAALDRILKLL